MNLFEPDTATQNPTSWVVFFGGTSKIAEHLVRQCLNDGRHILFIGRSANKMAIFMKGMSLAENDLVRFHTNPLNTQCAIEASLSWVDACAVTIDTVYICAGTIFEEEVEEDITRYIESLNVNTLLPLVVTKHFHKYENVKIITLSSLFALAPKRRKNFYSYSKKIFLVFHRAWTAKQVKKHYIFLLGPVYTPMYSGPRRFYVTEPGKVATKILEVVKLDSGGSYIVPGWWALLLYPLTLLNLF